MVKSRGLCVDFNISIPAEAVTHIKEKSFYDHNYYSVENYGDWFYGELHVISQVYDEFSNSYEYGLGNFKDGKFVGVIYWASQIDIFH